MTALTEAPDFTDDVGTAPHTTVWQQSAFWYLAGLEDGDRRAAAARGRDPFPHGPTTPMGREFIRAYADACRATHAAVCWPYLPDFYTDWKSARSKASA